MSDYARQQAILAKLQRYQVAVRQILLREWDPIGVAEVGPQDEYDTYVDQVCVKLMRNAGHDELAEYLWRCESEDIGMPGTKDHLDHVVTNLMKVRDEIEQADP